MKILVVMAGDGKRFSSSGYKTIKPLIGIGDKTILEWTTRSLPFIKHYGTSDVKKDYDLGFSIREEHDIRCDLKNKLKKIYGNEIKIKSFKSLTKGNLETAYLSVLDLFSDSLEEELLILDADNHYNGNNFLFNINNIRLKQQNNNFGSVCYFYPKNKDPKWCFAKIDKKSDKVISLHEKELVTDSYPMVGVFYYSKISLFIKMAKEILQTELRVKNEYYLSQTFQKLLENNVPVYGIMVPDVCPLGTPEDVLEYSKLLTKNNNTFLEQEEDKNEKENRY